MKNKFVVRKVAAAGGGSNYQVVLTDNANGSAVVVTSKDEYPADIAAEKLNLCTDRIEDGDPKCWVVKGVGVLGEKPK